MKRAVLIEEISKKVGLKKATVRKVLEAFEDVAYEGFRDGKLKKVSLGRKLGKLVVKEKKTRKVRNPQTGKVMEVPAREIVQFRMSKTLKEVLLKKALVESVELPF